MSDQAEPIDRTASGQSTRNWLFPVTLRKAPEGPEASYTQLTPVACSVCGVPRAGSGQGQTPFTRWGHASCPATTGTSTLYTGWVASGHWNHHGSGSSQLCMPLEEAHETNLPQTTKVLAELYRTEYRSSGALAEFTAQDVDNKEVPCAVCATPGHATLMVPAWHECPTGWTEQYDGWLMAEKQSSLHTSEWICVDHQPQALNNSDPAAQTDSNTL